ncbi:MAG: metallophosphoesterase [Acetobacter sp.]|nr:metallophosphoesterase [Acetobacter sp.]
MNRHFACSDLHGMWKLWEQISAFCDESDTIFFLGDAADRGPDGLKLMKTLLIDRRVQYIKGNHEDMLINAYYENDFWLVSYNGGNQTIKDFQRLSDENQSWLIRRLEILPKEIEYTSSNGTHIVMNHSGYNPEQKLIVGSKEDPYIWDRKQIPYPWKGDDRIIVHGHTPIPHLIQKLNEVSCITNEAWDMPQKKEDVSIIRYCGGHKIDIDLGAFATGKAALLDLDTLEVQYFMTEVKGQ